MSGRAYRGLGCLMSVTLSVLILSSVGPEASAADAEATLAHAGAEAHLRIRWEDAEPMGFDPLSPVRPRGLTRRIRYTCVGHPEEAIVELSGPGVDEVDLEVVLRGRHLGRQELDHVPGWTEPGYRSPVVDEAVASPTMRGERPGTVGEPVPVPGSEEGWLRRHRLTYESEGLGSATLIVVVRLRADPNASAAASRRRGSGSGRSIRAQSKRRPGTATASPPTATSGRPGTSSSPPDTVTSRGPPPRRGIGRRRPGTRLWADAPGRSSATRRRRAREGRDPRADHQRGGLESRNAVTELAAIPTTPGRVSRSCAGSRRPGAPPRPGCGRSCGTRPEGLPGRRRRA